MDNQKLMTRAAAAAGMFAVALPSFAEIDIAAATTGVADAKTAVLAVLAAMITFAVAAWAVKKVLRLFGR